MTEENHWTAPQEKQVELNEAVYDLTHSEKFREVQTQALELERLQESIRMAEETKYSSYIEVALEDIHRFKRKWDIVDK